MSESLFGMSRQKCRVETERLVLREALTADVDDLYECFSDPVAMRYWSTLPHPSKETTADWIDKMIKSPMNGISDFIITLKSSRSISRKDNVGASPCVGKIGIWSGNEVGFILARRFWGQGYAREALSALLDMAFEVDKQITASNQPVQRLEEVIADVDPRNQASLGLLQKAGFQKYETKTKTLQVGDEWVDSVYLKVTRSQWVEVRKTFNPGQASNRAQ